MQNIEQFVKRVMTYNVTVALLTGVGCCIGALVVLVKKINSHREMKEKIERARNRRDESLQQAEEVVLQYKQSHPTTDAAFIMSLSLSELTKQLKEGSLSPEDVLYSYIEKTLAVNKKLNCCTEILLESLDQLKTVGSNKEGLLYGVPVSIKENVAVKNHDCSCGVVINLDQPAEKDSVLVQVLKKQGAIPFVKTNLPQALWSFACSNPIYGKTVNPHNPQKTSGGSSGGEGALIGGGGSLLGIGSDLGGSIRIPASFCGICGFKPTSGRLSLQGLHSISRGQNLVLSSPGPMARDVDSLALCMQALLCDHMFSLDPTVPPLPFNMEIYRSAKPLRIGYLENNGYMQPFPSMARGIREIKALLEQAGHTVRLHHTQESEQTLLKGEPLDPIIKEQFFIYFLPKWLKKILSFLLKPVDYIHETIAHWRSYNIDVLLCPVPGPAYNASYCGRIPTLASCTVLYNLLNFPVGVVPVSTVTAEDEEELNHQQMLSKPFKAAMSGGEGLPVAVQCVALPWQDELCLRFMKELEQLVKQKKK
uniref:Fatty-acid amide hydrolase 1 n=1 Tax=Amphilophus citrinellus TaxID=61819 RepID=A0A3Q0S6Y3_AMPCI